MKLSIISVILLFIAACNGGGPSTQNEEKEPISELERINQIILADPDEATGYYQRALYQQQKDSLLAALADMERAILLDSTQAVYFETQGGIRYRSRDIKGAMSSFEKCIELDVSNTECKFRKAEILLVLRRYQETLDLVNEALRINENAAKGYYIKGWVYKELADTNLAISSMRTAVELDPEYYDAWIQLGLLHAARYDDLAIEYYNSAIDIKPKSTEAWYNKGMFAQSIGWDSLALECYTEIISFDPNNPTAYYNSGWVELELIGNNKNAIKMFDMALNLMPQYHQAYYNRGLAKEREGEIDGARDDFRRALAVQPDYELAANGLDRLDRLN